MGLAIGRLDPLFEHQRRLSADLVAILRHHRQSRRETIRPVEIVEAGKGEQSRLWPSVYACWKCGNILPSLVVPSAVCGFLLNGADLMLPGVLVPTAGLGEFKVLLAQLSEHACLIAVLAGRRLEACASLWQSSTRSSDAIAARFT